MWGGKKKRARELRRVGQYGEPSQKVLLLQCYNIPPPPLNHFLYAFHPSFISPYYGESVESLVMK